MTIEERLEEIKALLLAHQQTCTNGLRPLLSIKKAAALLDISEAYIRRHIVSGAWPSYREGKVLRVDPEEIRDRLAEGATRPPDLNRQGRGKTLSSGRPKLSARNGG